MRLHFAERLSRFVLNRCSRRALDARLSHIYIVDTTRKVNMRVAFLKWGNSLALRVPKAFAQEIGASVGKAANMEVRDGKLVVEIARPKRSRRYSLEQLVAGIRPENRHRELEWGPPVGNEIW
jgi:antitoxin MazE